MNNVKKPSLKFLKTEAEYEQALADAKQLMDAKPNSEEYRHLKVLVKLIDSYEERTFLKDLKTAPGDLLLEALLSSRVPAETDPIHSDAWTQLEETTGTN